MSQYVPKTSNGFLPRNFKESVEIASPHHLRTGSMADRRHRAIGLHPETPAIETPPPPVIEDTEGRRQDEADRLRRRRGRAAAIVNDGSAPTTAAKVLLGQ